MLWITAFWRVFFREQTKKLSVKQPANFRKFVLPKNGCLLQTHLKKTSEPEQILIAFEYQRHLCKSWSIFFFELAMEEKARKKVHPIQTPTIQDCQRIIILTWTHNYVNRIMLLSNKNWPSVFKKNKCSDSSMKLLLPIGK